MKKAIQWAVTLIVAALLVIWLTGLDGNKTANGMLLSVLQKSVILAVVACSMNLLNGFTGLFSLGQAGFMAIGAYTTALLTIPTKNLDGVYYMNGIAPGIKALRVAMDTAPEWMQACYPFLALLAGGVIAALFAALIGFPVLRLKSDYLAIATLGFSEIVRAIIASPQLDTITNGSYGLNKIPSFASTLVPFAVAALCIGIMVLMIHSSYGRAFKAIREDEVAAEAMGINLLRHKQMSFVTSSFFTAVAGGLLAMFMRSIEAKTFSVTMTYDILLIVVIGGIGSITGSVVGAFLVTASKEWWLRFFDQPLTIGTWQVPLFRTGFRMVVFSVLLMVVVLFYQRGLLGTREFNWNFIFPSSWKNYKLPWKKRKASKASTGGIDHE